MIRTRFAPSPTGFVHVGSLRTALYNYLFAKNQKGTFILRIEDTDRNRLVEGALENLLKTLEWAGMEYDEGPDRKGDFGPYIQSERTEIYRKYAQLLLEKGAAYPCFCTSERLDAMRTKQTELKQAPMYDRTCLNLGKDEIAAKIAAGTPYVLRQKIPHGRKLKFKDLIRGPVLFETDTIDDQILMKSDNFPTYHLANVIDDHLMEISHVIRGEEWLPSTPKHLLLYEALGWTPPEFAHIPLLLNKDKSKLSKRQGDVAVEDYIGKGYTKEALINFVAFLGWHPGKGEETEIFSLTELVEKFSLEKVHKSGAIFDVEKLNWFNFMWQRKMHTKKLEEIARSLDKNVQITSNQKGELLFNFTSGENQKTFIRKRAELLLEMCKNHIPDKWKSDNVEKLNKALITIEEKILKNPHETEIHLKLFFEPSEFPLSLLLSEKMAIDENMAETALTDSCEWLKEFSEFDSPEKIQASLISMISGKGLKNGQILWPLRVALTGEQYSPGVFEVIWALGQKECLERVKKVLYGLFGKSV
jgi:glutamyl-tRNA synthetase